MHAKLDHVLFFVFFCVLLHVRTYNCSHIYQPVMNSLTHVASHLDNDGKRRDLLMKTLQIFVQQGIEAHRASERNEAQFSHKVCKKQQQKEKKRKEKVNTCGKYVLHVRNVIYLVCNIILLCLSLTN